MNLQYRSIKIKIVMYSGTDINKLHSANSFTFSELSISNKLGIEIQSKIRVFSLDQLGIDSKKLITLLSSNVAGLTWDFYDVRKAQLKFLLKKLPQYSAKIKEIETDYYLGNIARNQIEEFVRLLTEEECLAFKKIKPHRRRSICQFVLSKVDENWSVERIFEDKFTQDVEDYREDGRIFEQTNQETTDHVEFRKLLIGLATLTSSFRPKAKKIKIVAHEMATITVQDTPGDNSPEGIHQDGSEFIVSALVIERIGIQGGYSQIYGPDKKTKYIDYILQPGEGLFQEDKGTKLWHKVSSIHLDPDSNLEMGQRNILGFDIDVIQ